MQSLTFLPLLLALSQFLATLVLPAAACDVSVGQQVQIYVYRDQTTDGAPLSSFPQYYGCLRINKRAGSSPWINVRSGAFSSSECAQFKVIEGGGAYGTDTCSVRLQALETNALVNRNGDWIYAAGAADDTSHSTLLLFTRYTSRYLSDVIYRVRTADMSSSDYFEAQYDSGDVNAKNSGFTTYLQFKTF